ncbi:hypothetical protein EDB81DRAFT_389693 [Dactylonectria macrodidyma]|uniref:Uncharacterized protein n=1 Tax=Dactylonectria macrodidyma TaxID=307937 RepID=A0A9P9FAR0_9HYPO|nr:hypothetical protein EDB81DRAFT_389693 [Dactylonectria macrodidyma]
MTLSPRHLTQMPHYRRTAPARLELPSGRVRVNTRPAYITGGRLLAWNAIGDAVGNEAQHEIPGKAFLVQTPKEEESLRFSFTDKFEVVRCVIRFTDSGIVEDGLTFRHTSTDPK